MIESSTGDGMRSAHRNGRRLAAAARGTESRTPPRYQRQQYGVQGHPNA